MQHRGGSAIGYRQMSERRLKAEEYLATESPGGQKDFQVGPPTTPYRQIISNNHPISKNRIHYLFLTGRGRLRAPWRQLSVIHPTRSTMPTDVGACTGEISESRFVDYYPCRM